VIDRNVFPVDPEIKPVPPVDGGRIRYQLINEFQQVPYLIPSGYITDGASIPRLFWRFIGGPYSHPYIYPALVHDFRYEVHGHPWDLDYLITARQKRLIKNELDRNSSRKEIDQDFYNGLLAAGMPKWKAKLMYWAVRIGGGKTWEKS